MCMFFYTKELWEEFPKFKEHLKWFLQANNLFTFPKEYSDRFFRPNNLYSSLKEKALWGNKVFSSLKNTLKRFLRTQEDSLEHIAFH